jgi:hypothetical protein
MLSCRRLAYAEISNGFIHRKLLLDHFKTSLKHQKACCLGGRTVRELYAKFHCEGEKVEEQS